MSVEFGASDQDDARRQIELSECGLWRAVGGDRRCNCRRQRGDTADTGFDAEIAVTVLGPGADSSPRPLWQITTSGCAAASAAACAATKLAITPANAIA